MQHITKPSGSRVRGLIAASAVTCAALLPASPVSDRASVADDRPHILEGEVADLIVPFHGGLCTGTPIAGTVYVVTAAHCVLTRSGEVRKRALVRDGVLYPAASVLVDLDYHDDPSVELDAAVLVMDEVIPGPAARVGSSLPDRGQLTLAGFQRTDGAGALMRVIDPNDQPAPKRAAGSPVDRPWGPAGCVTSVESLVVSSGRVTVPCGLVPGASGGPLLAVDNGEFVVVGILSTVTTDLSANGVVPLDSLLELLAHPERYAHDFETGPDHRDRSRSPDMIDRRAP